MTKTGNVIQGKFRPVGFPEVIGEALDLLHSKSKVMPHSGQGSPNLIECVLEIEGKPYLVRFEKL